MKTDVPEAILLSGPTGVGKSSLAISLVKKFKNLEIVNADSVLFYRHFDVGSAKPTALEQSEVSHHLIDICDPDFQMDVAQFKARVEETLESLKRRKKRALIVGGSGFYLKALRYGLWEVTGTHPEFRKTLESVSQDDLHQRLTQKDPDAALKIAAADRYRVIRALEVLEFSGQLPSKVAEQHNKNPDPRFELWVVDRNKEEFESRLRKRVTEMLNSGWMNEVQNLRKNWPKSRVLRAVGYAQVMDYLDQKEPEGRVMKPGLEGLVDEVVLAHRQLCKSQRTWFRGLKPEKEFLLDQDLAKIFIEIEAWQQTPRL